jgi:hypothetical protein
VRWRKLAARLKIGTVKNYGSALTLVLNHCPHHFMHATLYRDEKFEFLR